MSGLLNADIMSRHCTEWLMVFVFREEVQSDQELD